MKTNNNQCSLRGYVVQCSCCSCSPSTSGGCAGSLQKQQGSKQERRKNDRTELQVEEWSVNITMYSRNITSYMPAHHLSAMTPWLSFILLFFTVHCSFNICNFFIIKFALRLQSFECDRVWSGKYTNIFKGTCQLNLQVMLIVCLYYAVSHPRRQ